MVSKTDQTEEYPNIGMNETSTINTGEPVVDNPGYLIQNLYYWYKSTFNHYIKSIPPAFPEDFTIVPTCTGKIISSVTDDYSSKAIRLMVTPVGEKGQMGSGYPSNNLLISGLPVNEDLLIHLDASMIDLTDDVSSDRVMRWKDIGPYKLNVDDSSANNRPQITQHTVLDFDSHQVFGITRFPSENHQFLTVDNSNSIYDDKDNMTVYVAAKFDTDFAVTSNVLILRSANGQDTNR